MKLILEGLNVDPNDHNYTDTPDRYARALAELFQPPETEWATFKEEYTDFVLLRGYQMFSLCPHHMFPVRFTVSLAYIPDGYVLGLSKLARLLNECNDGPLLQEGFTKRAVDKVYEVCQKVKGAACIIQGTHGCMEMRGVKSDANFITYKMRGAFETEAILEKRFFDLARSR
jgi:GTP cyclohydrolase I